MTVEFWDVLRNRHSVRDFRSDPVPREVLKKVVEAAALAPSAMNSQPWRFHICTGGSRLEIGKLVAQSTVHLTEFMDVLGPERYEDALRWYSSLGDAPVVIAVSCEKIEGQWDALNKLLSVGAAVENLLLACTAEGLAACNITFVMWAQNGLDEFLALDEGREVVGIIAVGYASESPPAAPVHNLDAADWLD